MERSDPMKIASGLTNRHDHQVVDEPGKIKTTTPANAGVALLRFNRQKADQAATFSRR
jgi:hypothetical protein